MAKIIELTQGLISVVDDADFEWLSQWKWFAAKSGARYYARRGVNRGGRVTLYHMHRELMSPPDGLLVDHRNGNGLDNRRENLRLATQLENTRNVRRVIGRTSKLKGAWFDSSPGRNPWRSAIRINGKLVHLGRFATEEEAAAAYDQAAREHFGEFAATNGDILSCSF